ncbi:MAG TPA: hypothetical protein VFG10_16390 [Saprospiraceae bacterium]|nr:hypothetical protein [Saprospiraceae bacterium]
MKRIFSMLCLVVVAKLCFTQGNVGIGTSGPHAPLHIANGYASRKFILQEVQNNDREFFGFGVNDISATEKILRYQVAGGTGNHVFYSGSGTLDHELLRITGHGDVGIGGVSDPHGQLHFINATVDLKKIILYEAGNNTNQFLGFGNENGRLRYQVADPTGAHVFYAGTGTTSSAELMRITGEGKVGIGVSTPFESLEVGDLGRAFFGNGGGASRIGLLIDGDDPNNASRIEAYNYGTNTGRNLIINTAGGGNVGIDVPVPTEKLHVSGNARVTGNVVVGGTIEIEAVIPIPLQAGYTNYGAGYGGAGYYKDKMGIVHLRGVITHPTNTSTVTIYTLPAGYRPAAHAIFAAVNDLETCRIDVSSFGFIIISHVVPGLVSLDGITFRVE